MSDSIKTDSANLPRSPIEPGSRDFAAEVATATASLGTDRATAVCQLRALEESWARQLLRIAAGPEIASAVRSQVSAGLIRSGTQRKPDLAAAREAATRLAAAESWQWEIGSWASGSGEGLASMAEVRSLQIAQAWLAAALSSAERELALALASEVEADANGMGKPHAEAIRELRAAVPARD